MIINTFLFRICYLGWKYNEKTKNIGSEETKIIDVEKEYLKIVRTFFVFLVLFTNDYNE